MTGAVEVVPREVTGEISARLLDYVERVLGPESLGDLLRTAGERRPLSEVRDSLTWHSFEQVEALIAAAIEATGDGELGRRVGEEMFRQGRMTGVTDFFVTTGSIEAAFEAVANVSTKMSMGRTLRVTAAGPAEAVLEGVYRRLDRASPFYCGISAGYYAHLPSVFGAEAVVAETSCQFRNDPVCTFRVRWTRLAELDGISGIIEAGRQRQENVVESLERLNSMGSLLAGADDVDTLLDTIVDGAATAVRAPRYLLAVRIGEEAEVRVHHRGFSADAAREFAETLLSDEGDDVPPSTLVVDVASPRRSYGRLAAVFASDAVATAVESRLLRSYAGHAVAALERIESLEAARRERDTARSLLELATALAEVGTTEEVAARLARTVPGITDCDEVSVWLWDADAQALNLASWLDADGNDRARGDRRFTAAELPGLAATSCAPKPFVIDAASTNERLAGPMQMTGLTVAAVVPIAARGEFLGLVSAGFQKLSNERRQWLFRVLAGLADHAATALDNARLLERIRHQAIYDPLTSLPNRRFMEEQATSALASSQRTGTRSAVLFIDLDRFKNVNDTLGHGAGDELIREVADRLRGCIGPDHLLARLGGDEFVVVMPCLGSTADASNLAERVISSVQGPFHVAGQELFISCSIGVSTAPDDGSDYETLLQHADSAMYAAKTLGRSTFAVAGRTVAKQKRDHLQIESALHRAVDNCELRVLYQPQVDLTTTRVVGVEALVRWEHPVLGMLAPDAFLSVAEESALIVPIDRWVREQAFEQAAAWTRAGMPLRVAVNLSTREVRDPRLPDELARLIRSVGIAPELVEIEITDRVVMSEDDLPARVEALRDIGVRIAIDDFGTGTSVLGRLQGCAVDALKIDRSFVQEIDANNAEAPVVGALIAMAAGLGVQVVAEGVETDAQRSALRGLGCHLAQGFLFSPPVTAAQVESLAGGILRRS